MEEKNQRQKQGQEKPCKPEELRPIPPDEPAEGDLEVVEESLRIHEKAEKK
ncbi:MAG: hypothetical protein IRZ15_09410 [Bryobacteraceae bacterium]|nr:hypothetical protein [Bryobacteraceae bacterium]